MLEAYVALRVSDHFKKDQITTDIRRGNRLELITNKKIALARF